MNTPRKPALGMTEPDWVRFTPEQNVVHLAPVMGLEAALTAVFGDKWEIDWFEKMYVVKNVGWGEDDNSNAYEVIFEIRFWIDEGQVRYKIRFARGRAITPEDV